MKFLSDKTNLAANLSISMPMPSVSTVPSYLNCGKLNSNSEPQLFYRNLWTYLYQAMVSIPTVVITPPKHPNFSIRITSAPALLAAKAADKPQI